MSEIALKYGIKMESCAKKINLEQFGIEHGHCISFTTSVTIMLDHDTAPLPQICDSVWETREAARTI